MAMKWTYERINALLWHHGLPDIEPHAVGHAVMDKLDQKTGVTTTGGRRQTYYGTRLPRNPVGKRIALHEHEVAMRTRSKEYHFYGLSRPY